jgi:hypothetical protein
MYPKPSRTPVLRACLIFFVLTLLSYSPIFAQRRGSGGINSDGDMIGGSTHNSGGFIREDGWGLSLSAGYETPNGDLKEIYKGAPTFGLTLTRRMGNIVYSGMVDSRMYKPRQDVYIYSEEGFPDIYQAYSKYRGIGLYLGVAYELPVTGFIDIYGGVNAGFVFTSFKAIASDGTTEVTASADTQVGYIGPKIGFNVAISNNISIGVEGRYGLAFSGGGYNSREGGSLQNGFNATSGNLFITYNF